MTDDSVRKIELEPGDVLFAVVKGNVGSLATAITEEAIGKFCAGCDHLGPDGVCKLVGSNDQARYAARRWCGWADKDGKRGKMTSEGFRES